MWARWHVSDQRVWWAGRESNPHSRRRLIYSQRSSPPAQPTHGLRYVPPRRGCLVVKRMTGAASSSVGADDGTRTRNRRFTKPLLYQLSYVGGDAEGYRTPPESAQRVAGPPPPSSGRRRAGFGRWQRLTSASDASGRTQPPGGLGRARRAASSGPPDAGPRVRRRRSVPDGRRSDRAASASGSAAMPLGSSEPAASSGRGVRSACLVGRGVASGRLASGAASSGRRPPSGLGAAGGVRAPPGRCAAASNSSTEPATAALSEPTAAHRDAHRQVEAPPDAARMPRPSLPTTSASGPAQVRVAIGQRRATRRRRRCAAHGRGGRPGRPRGRRAGTSRRCSTAPAEALIAAGADGRRRDGSGRARRGRRRPRRCAAACPRSGDPRASRAPARTAARRARGRAR